VDWQTIAAVATVLAFVLTVIKLAANLRSKQRALKAREKELIEVAREREREARERERKTIVHLINRLEPHQVLDAELAPPMGSTTVVPNPW
jgi:heme exporter protein D